MWWTFHNDSAAVKNHHNIGAANLLWASHFPYDDSNWPDDREQAVNITCGAPVNVQELLMNGNVGRLYGLQGYGQFSEDERTKFTALIHY